MSPNWLPVREAAKIAGTSKEYITRLLRKGRINGKQVGREWIVDPVSLQGYIATRGTNMGRPKKKAVTG
jgi:excisionase family DNA binding protein